MSPDAFAAWVAEARPALIRRAVRSYRLSHDDAAAAVDQRIEQWLPLCSMLATPGDAARSVMWGVRGLAINARRDQLVRDNHAAHVEHYAEPPETPLQRLERGEVMAALDSLKPEYREILWRVHVEGQSDREIERETGINQSNVTRRRQRAERAFRRALEERDA